MTKEEEELKLYGYYVLESCDSGERLVGQYFPGKYFYICGDSETHSVEEFIILREVDILE